MGFKARTAAGAVKEAIKIDKEFAYSLSKWE